MRLAKTRQEAAAAGISEQALKEVGAMSWRSQCRGTVQFCVLCLGLAFMLARWRKAT